MSQRSGMNPSAGVMQGLLAKSAHPWGRAVTHTPLVPVTPRPLHPGMQLGAPTATATTDGRLGVDGSGGAWTRLTSVVPQGSCQADNLDMYPMDNRSYLTYARAHPSPASNVCNTPATFAMWWPPAWHATGGPQYVPGKTGYMVGTYGGATL